MRLGSPFAYTDLSTPAVVYSKPLEAAESDNSITHLRKQLLVRMACPEGHCKKEFPNAGALREHLLEQPRFRTRPEEEQAEFIS